MSDFFQSLPDSCFEYFRPHGFSVSDLERVFGSRASLNYAITCTGELAGCGLLKFAPTGSAYPGMLVSPAWGGRGLGAFPVSYLHWQASVAGFRTRSTVSVNNPASLEAHRKVGEIRVVAAELPNDYELIEFLQPSYECPLAGRDPDAD